MGKGAPGGVRGGQGWPGGARAARGGQGGSEGRAAKRAGQSKTGLKSRILAEFQEGLGAP